MIGDMTKYYTCWRKSSHSEPNGECVEVGRASDGTIGVRDTKHVDRGLVLEFTHAEWQTFLASVRKSTKRGR